MSAIGPSAADVSARAGESFAPPCDSAVARQRWSTDVVDGVLASLQLHGATTRWPDRHGAPLRLWVQRRVDRAGTPAVRRTPGEWQEAVVTAARAWGRVPSVPPFRVTRDSSRADVWIVWTRTLTPPGGPALGDVLAPVAAGNTAIRRGADGAITSAVVTLATETWSGLPYSRRDVTAVALHELGHVLGLAHRADAASVMSPVVTSEAVAPVDVATIHALYTLPVGLRCDDTRVAASAAGDGPPR